MKLVSVAEMKSIEKKADDAGLSYGQMMENAGSALAAWVQSHYGHLVEPGVIGLVGPGNNGGDCLVALAALCSTGWRGCALLVKAREKNDPLLKRFEDSGGKILSPKDDPDLVEFGRCLEDSPVVLDGVLGTGFRLPLKPDLAQILGEVKKIITDNPGENIVIAVDCPSGVDCDTGEAAEEVIPAAITICMAAVKDGLLKYPAFRLAGEISTVDIGLSEDLPEWKNVMREVAGIDEVQKILPRRGPETHKGTFGTALVVAGSTNFSGAALLAGEAAYRMGTGLVTLAVPGPLHTALASAIPEATWLLLPHEMGVISSSAVDLLLKNLEKIDAMLLGPGWGQEETTKDFLERLVLGTQPAKRVAIGFVKSDAVEEARNSLILPPLVIDADGLKLLTKIEEWWTHLPDTTILTPHPGEMSVLTGLSIPEIQADRWATAVKFAGEWKKIVVLKGAFTIVAEPSGKATLIPVATSGLAKGGTGDVLAGMITGLRAQGVTAYEAAVAAVWIHGMAGLAAVEDAGSGASVLARDVIRAIGDVLSDVLPEEAC